MNTRRRSHLDITHTKSLTIEDTAATDRTKYLTLSHVNLPIISQAATLRLAGSDVKARPRLPSPPRSPVAPIRNLPTPKINISDTSLYDTVIPDKPRATHGRSKSLDNKPLNLTLVEIPNTPSTSITTNTTTTAAKNNEKQTVNYATLEHKVTLKTIKNNTKCNENSNAEKCSYSEMSQSQKQTILKQAKNEDKPQVPPKNNALKQMQTRAYSAPESYRSQPTTVIYIPEEKFKSDYKKCFETFPKEKRCQEGHRSRYDAARCGSMGRSSSVPEQRYVVTARPDVPEPPRRRKDGPVVTIQHQTSESPHKTLSRTFSNSQATPNQSSSKTQSTSTTRSINTQSATSRGASTTQDTPNKTATNAQATPIRNASTRTGNAPSTPARIVTNSQATPTRTSQYYSSSFDAPLRQSVGAYHGFETPVTNLHHSRNSQSFDVPSRNYFHQHKGHSHDSPSTKGHPTPARTSSLSQKTSSSYDDSPRRAPYQFAADIIRSTGHHHALHSDSRPHHQNYDSSNSAHVTTPARSSSLQQPAVQKTAANQVKGTPKRNPGILQYSSKSLETPPRSSNLHQHVAPVVAPIRTTSLQHAASAEATPTKTPGILKTRRRSRSRELDGELPPAPSSPRDSCDAQNREILLTIKRQTHGYMKPP